MFYFGGTGDRTQGFTLAMTELLDRLAQSSLSFSMAAVLALEVSMTIAVSGAELLLRAGKALNAIPSTGRGRGS